MMTSRQGETTCQWCQSPLSRQQVEQSFSVQHLLDKVGGQHHDAWRNNRCGTFLALSWPNFPALRIHWNELNRAMDTKFNSNTTNMMNENHCHTGAKIETFRHASWDWSKLCQPKNHDKEERSLRKQTSCRDLWQRGIKYPSSSDFAKRESKRIYTLGMFTCLLLKPHQGPVTLPLRLSLAWQRMAVHVAALWWSQGHPQTIRPLWVPP